jgi:DNA-binding transcriptional regulator YiaG
LKTLVRKGSLKMSIANKALPVKMRWSISALQKLRGERTVEVFAALLDAPVELVIAWEDGSIKPVEKYVARLTDLARSEPERYKDWTLMGSGTIACNDLEAAIEKMRDDEQRAFERRKRFILEGE